MATRRILELRKGRGRPGRWRCRRWRAVERERAWVSRDSRNAIEGIGRPAEARPNGEMAAAPRAVENPADKNHAFDQLPKCPTHRHVQTPASSGYCQLGGVSVPVPVSWALSGNTDRRRDFYRLDFLTASALRPFSPFARLGRAGQFPIAFRLSLDTHDLCSRRRRHRRQRHLAWPSATLLSSRISPWHPLFLLASPLLRLRKRAAS